MNSELVNYIEQQLNKKGKKDIQSVKLIVIFFSLLLLGFCGYLFLKSRDIYYLPDFLFPQPSITDNQSNWEFRSWLSLNSRDFFNNIRDKFVSEKTNFIEADLSSMVLKVYHDGLMVKEIPILTKGEKGSWRETPTGIYRVESKEKKHLTSSGKIYMPWALNFQGNFFIHGWPYYTSGDPMTSEFSQGCIRLLIEDAETVFNLVKVGFPVLVFEENLGNDDFEYQRKISNISANSYIAVDLNNDAVLIEEKSSEILPIASITKLITALIASDYINFKKEITISKEMIVKTSKPRLKIGQKIAVYDLFFLLLRESSNEAANALAIFLGKERFLNLMNKKAQSLGMENTKFADSSGSSWDNVSNARDLALLAKYIYHNAIYLFRITSGKINSSPYGPLGYSDLGNFNIFEKEPEFLGGKTGLNSLSKETMLAVFEFEFKNQKRPVAIIVLGSDDHEKDIRLIIKWIKENWF